MCLLFRPLYSLYHPEPKINFLHEPRPSPYNTRLESNQSPELRAQIRALGGLARNMAEAEAAEIEAIMKKQKKAELEAEGRI